MDRPRSRQAVLASSPTSQRPLLLPQVLAVCFRLQLLLHRLKRVPRRHPCSQISTPRASQPRRLHQFPAQHQHKPPRLHLLVMACSVSRQPNRLTHPPQHRAFSATRPQQVKALPLQDRLLAHRLLVMQQAQQFHRVWVAQPTLRVRHPRRVQLPQVALALLTSPSTRSSRCGPPRSLNTRRLSKTSPSVSAHGIVTLWKTATR